MKKNKNIRRRDALKRLEAQLESGVKTRKKTLAELDELTEQDIKRIKREIIKLKARIHGK